MYGLGAVIGFTPQQVDAMTLWEFEACVDGYALAHGAKKPIMSEAEYDKLVKLGESWNKKDSKK